MAAPEYTPLPTAPARTMTPTAFAAAADAFVAALAVFQTEGDTLGAYTLAQAEAALAAAVAGNLSELDLTALAGWVIGVNDAGDALEGVELVPPSTATETDAGIVEKGTTVEAEEGTEADKFPDVVGVKSAIDKQRPAPYESGQQTITSAGALALTHGLGKRPLWVQAVLECITDEDGYVTGEFVPVTLVNNSSSAVSRANGIKITSAQILIRFSDQTECFIFGHEATGVLSNATNANWKLHITAGV